MLLNERSPTTRADEISLVDSVGGKNRHGWFVPRSRPYATNHLRRQFEAAHKCFVRRSDLRDSGRTEVGLAGCFVRFDTKTSCRCVCDI